MEMSNAVLRSAQQGEALGGLGWDEFMVELRTRRAVTPPHMGYGKFSRAPKAPDTSGKHAIAMPTYGNRVRQGG